MNPPIPRQTLAARQAHAHVYAHAARAQSGCRSALIWLGLTAALGCGDPVRDEQIAALGPEDPAVQLGPLHRPGQPCLLCHADAGIAPRFSVAGTVFLTPETAKPIGGVEIRLIDAARRWFVAYTNCAGNFFVEPQQYEPVLPLWATATGYGAQIEMDSPMNKDGDCNTCHRSKKSPSSAGLVFLAESAAALTTAPAGACAGTRP